MPLQIQVQLAEAAHRAVVQSLVRRTTPIAESLQLLVLGEMVGQEP